MGRNPKNEPNGIKVRVLRKTQDKIETKVTIFEGLL